MLRAVMTCETPDYWKDHFQKHGVQDVPVFYEQIAPGMAKIASLNAHCWLDLPREFDKRYPSFEGQVESLIARMPGIKREEDGYVSFTALEEYPNAPESLCLNAYGVVDSPDQFQEDFRKTLEAGFTTVRNVGSGDWNDVALKQAIEIEAQYLKGPKPWVWVTQGVAVAA